MAGRPGLDAHTRPAGPPDSFRRTARDGRDQSGIRTASSTVRRRGAAAPPADEMAAPPPGRRGDRGGLINVPDQAAPVQGPNRWAGTKP